MLQAILLNPRLVDDYEDITRNKVQDGCGLAVVTLFAGLDDVEIRIVCCSSKIYICMHK